MLTASRLPAQLERFPTLRQTWLRAQRQSSGPVTLPALLSILLESPQPFGLELRRRAWEEIRRGSELPVQLDRLADTVEQHVGGDPTLEQLLDACLASSADERLPAGRRLDREVRPDRGLSLDQHLQGESRGKSRTGPSPEGRDGVTPAAVNELPFATDLTARARAGFWVQSPVAGMDELIEEMLAKLRTKSDPLLITGPPGVGKSHLVYGLAYHLAHRSPFVPPTMWNYQVWEMAASDFLRGTGEQGALEQRLHEWQQYADANPESIFFLDEAHAFLVGGTPAAHNVLAKLKSRLEQQALSLVCATTEEEYEEFIARDAALASRFHAIRLSAPTLEQTVVRLAASRRNLLGELGRQHGLEIDADAIQVAVSDTSLYRPSRAQPRNAAQPLRAAVADRVWQLECGRDTRRRVTAEDVRQAVARAVGLPREYLDGNLDTLFAARCNAVARAYPDPELRTNLRVAFQRLANAAKGWKDPVRPDGRLLISGPGAATLARQIAEQLQPGRGRCLELDLGSLPIEGAANVFRGSTVGYVDSSRPSFYARCARGGDTVILLTQADRVPDAALDPLEKMLAGHDQDAFGRPHDFRNAIFLLTADDSEQLPGSLRTLCDDELVIQPHVAAERLRGDLTIAVATRLARSGTRPLPARLSSPSALEELVGLAAAQPGRSIDCLLDDWLVGEALAETAATQPPAQRAGGACDEQPQAGSSS